MKKVYIMGSGGTGKTTLSKLLMQKYKYPYLELDDIYWDNSKDNKAYNVKTDKQVRDKILQEFLEKNQTWIIDGVYYKEWVYSIFKSVDMVLILKPWFLLSQLRCIKRDIIKSFNGEKVGGIVALYHLLKWNIKYRYMVLPVVERYLKEKKIPYQILHTKEIEKLIADLRSQKEG